MSSPLLLQDKFDGGFKRDMPRDQLPKNAIWDMKDWIPNLGAPLRKRGGWSYQGVDLSTLDAAATVPKRVFWAAFDVVESGNSNTQVLAWDNNGKLFDLTTSVDRGDTTVPLHTPIFFRELVIWGSGAAAPKKYIGSTISDLGGSPPTNGRVCTVWKERVLFSGQNTDTAFDTIYFSAAGNAESWDTTNAQIGTNGPIQGLATLPNALLVFHPGSVEKILGDKPPSATSIGELSRQPLFNNVGLYEPTALAVQNESAYWADENGVYKSDGASIVDLTDKGGIRTYWQDLLATDAKSIALGVWRNYVFVSVRYASNDVYADFLVCDIEKKAWFRFGNIVAANFATRYAIFDELYFSNRQTKFVGALSSCFAPATAAQDDPDSDGITATIDTAFYRLQGKGKKRIRHVYWDYLLGDSGGFNPGISTSYYTTPEDTLATSLSPSPPENTETTRFRQRIGKALSGVGLHFESGGKSSDSRLFSIEVDVLTREASRR